MLNMGGISHACQIQIGSLAHLKRQTKNKWTVTKHQTQKECCSRIVQARQTIFKPEGTSLFCGHNLPPLIGI